MSRRAAPAPVGGRPPSTTRCWKRASRLTSTRSRSTTPGSSNDGDAVGPSARTAPNSKGDRARSRSSHPRPAPPAAPLHIAARRPSRRERPQSRLRDPSATQDACGYCDDRITTPGVMRCFESFVEFGRSGGRPSHAVGHTRRTSLSSNASAAVRTSTAKGASAARSEAPTDLGPRTGRQLRRLAVDESSPSPSSILPTEGPARSCSVRAVSSCPGPRCSRAGHGRSPRSAPSPARDPRANCEPRRDRWP